MSKELSAIDDALGLSRTGNPRSGGDRVREIERIEQHRFLNARISLQLQSQHDSLIGMLERELEIKIEDLATADQTRAIIRAIARLKAT